MAKYKYHAKCSQCGRGFRANTQSIILEKIRKHMWRMHREWMVRKIKTGLKKSKKKNNPVWLTALLGGIFPPAVIPMIKKQYKEANFAEREAIKMAVRAGVGGLAPAASPLAEIILQALEAYVMGEEVVQKLS